MLAQIEIQYSADSIIADLDDELYQNLREGFPALDLPLVRGEKFSVPYSKRRHTVDLTKDGVLLTSCGIPYTIERFKSCRKVETGNIVNLQVAIPNLLLFSVDEVEVIEDSCTDVLQNKLDEGWRILAVCPPANQRRPDYILGRTKEVK